VADTIRTLEQPAADTSSVRAPGFRAPEPYPVRLPTPPSRPHREHRRCPMAGLSGL